MTGEDGSQPSLKRLGSYELIRPLAQGGMADIYLAKKDNSPFERRIAIKVLNKLRATEEESCAMFLDEARLVGMLDHHNIASILEANITNDGHHYLAMEYVHGADLRELLSCAAKAGRAVPFEVSLSIIAAAAAGLDHAHGRCDPAGRPLRLVHRDVSLSNIMVSHDGAVKVVDFGIASTSVQTVHTSPGVVRGKASYMSPEQCLGDEVDHRTDIFALGIVLYELTTGARCFAGKSDFERMLSVVRGQYHLPTAIVSNYPPELEDIVRTALALNPAKRFPSCAAMIEALERVARGRRWTLGPTPIERIMHALYGTPTDITFAAPDADAPAPADTTQPHLSVFDQPEPTAREAPSARRATIDPAACPSPTETPPTTTDSPLETSTNAPAPTPTSLTSPTSPTAPTPTDRSQRRLAQGTNADGYATKLDGDDDEDDQPTRGRRPLPRRPSTPSIAA